MMMRIREGFTLVEVIIAMVILAVGILAMGASTGYIVTQVAVSDMRTNRMAAVREVAERLRATDFDDLGASCGGNFTVGSYTVSCSVSNVNIRLKRIEMVTTGPGYQTGYGIKPSVADTFNISIADT